MLEHLNDESFKNKVLDGQGVAVVDFWAAWCGPCRMLGPQFEALANEYDGKASFYKVDVESAQETAAALGVQSIPCVIYFKDGEIVDRNIGLVPKDALASKLKNIL